MANAARGAATKCGGWRRERSQRDHDPSSSRYRTSRSPRRSRILVDVPEYGVRAKRGDFEPLISEDLFYRVQSVLSDRLVRRRLSERILTSLARVRALRP